MNTTQTETINNALGNSISNRPVIEINNLKKSFGEQEVLLNVSLKLFKGENLVVVGKSGTGKSVLIKCIVGLLDSDGGTISVFEKNVSELSRQEFGDLRRNEKKNKPCTFNCC